MYLAIDPTPTTVAPIDSPKRTTSRADRFPEVSSCCFLFSDCALEPVLAIHPIIAGAVLRVMIIADQTNGYVPSVFTDSASNLAAVLSFPFPFFAALTVDTPNVGKWVVQKVVLLPET